MWKCEGVGDNSSHLKGTAENALHALHHDQRLHQQLNGVQHTQGSLSSKTALDHRVNFHIHLGPEEEEEEEEEENEARLQSSSLYPSFPPCLPACLPPSLPHLSDCSAAACQ